MKIEVTHTIKSKIDIDEYVEDQLESSSCDLNTIVDDLRSIVTEIIDDIWRYEIGMDPDSMTTDFYNQVCGPVQKSVYNHIHEQLENFNCLDFKESD